MQVLKDLNKGKYQRTMLAQDKGNYDGLMLIKESVQKLIITLLLITSFF